MHLLPAAGPRPTSLPWSSRLRALAWCQLAALALWTAFQVWGWTFLLSPEFDELTCLDRARPACEYDPPAWLVAAVVGADLLVLCGAAITLVLAHRRHTRATVLGLALTFLAALTIYAAQL